MEFDVVVLLEALMLVLFGASWPFNIYKAYKGKTTLGKSIQFDFIVIIGYVLGIIAKLIILDRTGSLQYSFWFYLLDITLVTIDICIYFRNLKIDKKEGRL